MDIIASIMDFCQVRPAMTIEKAEKIKWLEEALNQTGMRATPFAKAAGVSPSTLTDFIKNPDKKPPSDRIFNELASAHGLIPPAGRAAVPIKPGFAEDGAIELTPAHVGGSTEYNRIKQAYSDSNDEQFWVMSGRALENVDIKDGDILTVNYNRTAKPGDIVCISLRDEENRTAKTVFRQFLASEPFGICITATNDQSIQPNVNFADGNKVKIYGVVSMSSRKR